jgi:PAS domain S-box-containing protein
MARDAAFPVFVGDSAMAALMRTVDWAATPIGAVDGWPQSLRTALSICLESRFPILLWWGAQLVMLYNDAYRPMLGSSKHPRALGQAGRDCWPEIWEIIGPMLEGVLSRGEATWSEDQLLMLERSGFPEECYFTFSYSPIHEEGGGIGGVFTAVTETTAHVVGERSIRTLRDLATVAADARDAEDVCRRSAAVLAENAASIPFALLYLIDADGQCARLCGTSGFAAGDAAAPEYIDLTVAAAERGWPLAAFLRGDQATLLTDLPARFGALPAGPWPGSPVQALLLRLEQAGQTQSSGVLVAGLSPYRPLDEPYRGLFDLVAGQIGAAIASARTRAAERERAEALAELDRAKTAFFSNVSHEFRTPLTLMLGPLDELLAETAQPLHAAQREQLQIVRRNSRRLLRLVNTLLDFSRIEAGRADASYEPVDLAVVTAELAAAFRSTVEHAGLEYNVDCPPLPQQIYVDRAMWEKIVLNLLSNAFKFTLSGAISLRLRWQDGQAILTVVDTGAGVPADELPRLFERFHRVRGVRARTQEGSGIGLALVQELVRLHGGTIAVTSAPNEGTTFTVSLPAGSAHLPAERLIASRTIAPAPASTAAYVDEALQWLPDGEPDDVAGFALRGSSVVEFGEGRGAQQPVARILLADDNADMRLYVARLLRPYWQVDVVGDGVAALNAALATPPDLILADVMMPGLDGFALLRALRADQRTQRLPIILLSARAGEEARIEGLQAGADDYLVKPFAARELVARLSAHLALARLRDEAERAVRASEDRYRTLIELAPQAVWLADATGAAIFYNRYWLDYCGVALSELISGGWLEIVHPDDQPALIAAWGDAVREQREVAVEMRLRRADGVYRWHWGRGVPLRESDGRLNGWIGITVDIHDRRQAESERELFARSVTHDLKNPLTTLKAQTQLLMRQAQRQPLPAENWLLGGLARLQTTVNRMTAQLDELTDATRVQAGQPLELRLEPTDLVALLRGIVEAQQQTSEDHTLRFVALADALIGNWDGTRLERVAGNLLANAVKYSPDGGVVTIELRAERGGNHEWAVLCVRDQGIGVPAADLPYIFERFHRGANAIGRFSGTGIGLAGVKQIIEQHGGTVMAESREGEGTTITVRLPLSQGDG